MFQRFAMSGDEHSPATVGRYTGPTDSIQPPVAAMYAKEGDDGE